MRKRKRLKRSQLNKCLDPLQLPRKKGFFFHFLRRFKNVSNRFVAAYLYSKYRIDTDIFRYFILTGNKKRWMATESKKLHKLLNYKGKELNMYKFNEEARLG